MNKPTPTYIVKWTTADGSADWRFIEEETSEFSLARFNEAVRNLYLPAFLWIEDEGCITLVNSCHFDTSRNPAVANAPRYVPFSPTKAGMQ